MVRVASVLTVLILIGYILLATIGRMGLGTALYETLLDAAGNAVPDDKLSPFRKIVQVVIALIREDQRVLRLFDDDLAERIERTLGLTISRGVARLAASAFAAAMMERHVIGTLSIGRSVLMIAEVPIVVDSPLARQPIADGC